MHACTTIQQPAQLRSALTPVTHIRPGQHFIRLDSPDEILTPLSYAAGDVTSPGRVWVVVIATNRGSEGYVPGQLLSIGSTVHVRVVHEMRAPVYALEQ